MQDMHDDPDFRRTYGFLRRCAMRMCGDPATAQDLVQDALLVAHANADQFRGHAAYSTWLYGILRNIHRAHRRSVGRIERRHRAFAAHRQTLSETEQRDEMAQLEHALVDRELVEYLASLDAERRSAFIMMEIEGRTGHETAAALGINVHTAYGWVRATRQELSQRAEQRGKSDQRRSGVVLLPLLPGLGGLEWRVRRGPLRAAGGLLTAAAVVVCALGPGRASMARLVPPPTAVAHFDTAGSVPIAYPLTQPFALEAAAVEPRAESPPVKPKPETRPRRQSADRRSPSVQPSEHATQDYRRFAEARRVYTRGAARRALDLLAEIDRDGPLGWRRTATEIGALCYLGRRADAEDVAIRWSAQHPEKRLEVPRECDHELRAVVADDQLSRRDDDV